MREALDFCAEHGITPDVKSINVQEINDLSKRINNGEVRFRYSSMLPLKLDRK